MRSAVLIFFVVVAATIDSRDIAHAQGRPFDARRSALAQGRRGSPAPRPAPTAAPAPRETFFTSTLTPEELRNKQAVLETSLGTIVLDLLADAAPNHVAHFITRAREGGYNGTTFHRIIAMGIIQGSGRDA